MVEAGGASLAGDHYEGEGAFPLEAVAFPLEVVASPLEEAAFPLAEVQHQEVGPCVEGDEGASFQGEASYL